MTIKVVYENGVFRPTEKVNLSEGTVGEVALPKNGSASRGERDPQNLAVIMEAVRALANRDTEPKDGLVGSRDVDTILYGRPKDAP